LYNFVLEGGRKKTFMSYEERLANMVVKDGAESDPASDDEGSTGPLREVHDSDSETENDEEDDDDKTDVSIRSSKQDKAMEK
jgi:hypothetical protein